MDKTSPGDIIKIIPQTKQELEWITSITFPDLSPTSGFWRILTERNYWVPLHTPNTPEPEQMRALSWVCSYGFSAGREKSLDVQIGENLCVLCLLSPVWLCDCPGVYKQLWENLGLRWEQTPPVSSRKIISCHFGFANGGIFSALLDKFARGEREPVKISLPVQARHFLILSLLLSNISHSTGPSLNTI